MSRRSKHRGDGQLAVRCSCGKQLATTSTRNGHPQQRRAFDEVHLVAVVPCRLTTWGDTGPAHAALSAGVRIAVTRGQRFEMRCPRCQKVQQWSAARLLDAATDRDALEWIDLSDFDREADLYPVGNEARR